MEASSVQTIVCPKCSAELPVEAAQCHRCGQQTAVFKLGHPTEDQFIDRPWVILILILHVGCLGVPFYWKTKYSLGVRLAIIVVSIVYTMAVVGVIAWIGIYLVETANGLRLL